MRIKQRLECRKPQSTLERPESSKRSFKKWIHVLFVHKWTQYFSKLLVQIFKGLSTLFLSSLLQENDLREVFIYIYIFSYKEIADQRSPARSVKSFTVSPAVKPPFLTKAFPEGCEANNTEEPTRFHLPQLPHVSISQGSCSCDLPNFFACYRSRHSDTEYCTKV